jgi:hypothetical protein
MQVEVLEDRQLLATIVVNTTADNTAPAATLSLRQAIELSDGTLALSALTPQEQAQVSGGGNGTGVIDFNIPTTDPGYNPATGVWTIAPKSALPAITTNSALLNGYTQPGASKNTLVRGDNAKLAIAINGAGLGKVNGLTINSQFTQVSGLDIENFGGAGIVVQLGNSDVWGCFIGTDPTGETAAPNGNGVVLEGSGINIGGGTGDTEANRNVISGNSGPGAGYGIYVPDQADNPLNTTPNFNFVQDSYIGTDATGTKALGNSAAGVGDFGSGDIYGNTDTTGDNGIPNLISGNGDGGLKVTGSVTIGGNYIGTDVTGLVALGNGPAGFGIIDLAAGNTAVTTLISSNVVSGNAQTGIEIDGGSQSQSQYTISANKIGTKPDATGVLGNGGAGLELNSVENATVTGNVLGGNNIGLQVTGSGPDVEHNVFQENYIGGIDVGPTNTVELPNTTYGVLLTSAIGNVFGGTSPGNGNTIAFNGGDGIHVSGGQQDQFTQNSIFANGGAGIKLVSGANHSAKPPVLTWTPVTGETLTLDGTLTGSPNVSYTVEIFSNPSAPAAGHEQGETFIQDVTVKTDGSGKGSISLNEPDAFYTATATDPSGDTSGFSNAAGTSLQPATVTTVSASPNPSSLGEQVTFTAVVTPPGLQGTPTGTVTFTIDGQPQTPVPLSVVGGIDEAQFVTSALAAGQHSVSAAYSGDENFSASTGSLPTQTVTSSNFHATTTTLTSSLDPSTAGQQVTFTAVVTAPGFQGTPTGTVTFSIDGRPQTPVSLHAASGYAEATISIATLTPGTHKISAIYNGDATFAASAVVNPLIQTVNVIHNVYQPPPLVTMETVQVLRNKKHRVVEIIVGFSGELNAGRADSMSEYRLVRAVKRGLFTAKLANVIKLRSAVYNGTSDTVTLTPNKPFALTNPVQLQVSGDPPSGLDDVLGRLLDANDDFQPGGTAVAVLRRHSHTIDA